MQVVLKDPTSSPRALTGISERTLARFIHDPRDACFLKLMAVQSLLVIPTGLALFVPGALRWWTAALHLALVLYFQGPFVLMLHNTSHRRLFRRPWSWMNAYIPWVLGPFFGESPETYFAHHVGMHHPENNLPEDLSTTLPYRRDHAGDFARYFLRFFFAVFFGLAAYFVRKQRRTLLARMVIGELSFYALVGLGMLVDWRAATIVFVVPFVVVRFAMMAGNWAQHAFVDHTAPDNSYRNSITCINCGYNRRCFNDGYHIGHHLKATRHWTEMPDELRANAARYAAEGAIVFEGIDFFGVWLCLMLQRYDWLARRVVALDGVPRAPEETIALLRSRARAVWPPSELAGAAVSSAPRAL